MTKTYKCWTFHTVTDYIEATCSIDARAIYAAKYGVSIERVSARPVQS